MSFLDKLAKRQALKQAQAENRAFAAKFGNQKDTKNIPAMFTGNMQNDEIVREIKGTVTGGTIAYERKDGSWILAGMDYHVVQKDKHGKKFISSVKSPATEEYEAMQNLAYPVFVGVTGL